MDDSWIEDYFSRSGLISISGARDPDHVITFFFNEEQMSYINQNIGQLKERIIDRRLKLVFIIYEDQKFMLGLVDIDTGNSINIKSVPLSASSFEDFIQEVNPEAKINLLILVTISSQRTLAFPSKMFSYQFEGYLVKYMKSEQTPLNPTKS